MRIGAITLISAIVVLTTSGAARAVQLVSACNTTCTTDCELSRDIKCCPTSVSGCDGVGSITLTNGADLDLRGHNLLCGGDDAVNRYSFCYAPGVVMTSGNSVVKNGVANLSKIKGYFFYGVDCALKTGSRVTGVQLEDIAVSDVLNCAQVDKNVFMGAAADPGYQGHTAIQSSGVADSDAFYDNYIFEYFTGILLTGSKNVEIDHNTIVLGDPTNWAGYDFVGIDVSSATGNNLDVNHNVLMGAHAVPPIDGNAVSDFAKNVCDKNNSLCDDCAASGWCNANSAPFAGLR